MPDHWVKRIVNDGQIQTFSKPSVFRNKKLVFTQFWRNKLLSAQNYKWIFAKFYEDVADILSRAHDPGKS